MDNEEHGSSGLSGYAFYELGRMSAESAHEQKELVESLFGRAPVPVARHNHAVKAAADLRRECLRLQQVNAQLQAQLNAANVYQAELKAWADRCLADRDRWKQKCEDSKEQCRLMSRRANRFQAEVEQLKGSA